MKHCFQIAAVMTLLSCFSFCLEGREKEAEKPGVTSHYRQRKSTTRFDHKTSLPIILCSSTPSSWPLTRRTALFSRSAGRDLYDVARFLERINGHSENRPDLLTEDPVMQKVLASHPVLLWKVQKR